MSNTQTHYVVEYKIISKYKLCLVIDIVFKPKVLSPQIGHVIPDV